MMPQLAKELKEIVQAGTQPGKILFVAPSLGIRRVRVCSTMDAEFTEMMILFSHFPHRSLSCREQRVGRSVGL